MKALSTGPPTSMRVFKYSTRKYVCSSCSAACPRSPAQHPSPAPARTLATISAECHRGPAPAIQPSTLRIHSHNETISSVVLGTVESPLVVVGVRSRIPGSHTVDTV